LLPWTSPLLELYLLADFGVGQTIYVYGAAPPGQAVPSGSYSDTPVIVISF
jgi:spore coat protein U-like protein